MFLYVFLLLIRSTDWKISLSLSSNHRIFRTINCTIVPRGPVNPRTRENEPYCFRNPSTFEINDWDKVPKLRTCQKKKKKPFPLYLTTGPTPRLMSTLLFTYHEKRWGVIGSRTVRVTSKSKYYVLNSFF